MKNLALITLLLSSMTCFAQDISETPLSGLKFRSIGPALTSGRIADLAVNPADYNEYYVAVASGGVWKTTNHGITFSPIFDDQGSYSIGCVSLDPQNSKVVWVGTGENNGQRSVAYGDGVYKSVDGGSSWQNMGLKNSEHIGMIAIHPKNPDIVYVAAIGPLWNSGGDRGIYKTIDGGKSWQAVLQVSEHTGFNEIHFDPRNPEVLYATAHQRRRHVWTYVSGGPESAIYKSKDGGKNWQKLENGLPAGDKGRIALAIPPANPDRIYAMIEGHGIYRSDDRGASFQFQNDYNSSGNYYVELVPHPTDPNTLFSMDTYLQVSRDGGQNWENMPRENRHVDDHCLWINPGNTDHMLVGCDGGLYETYDAGENWHFKPNLPVTQFYRVTVDNDQPFYNIYGGTQDNFTLGGPSQTINNSGITNQDWYITNTGDGFETQIDPVNPDIVYSQAQYGELVRYDRKSGERIGIKPYPGLGEPAYRWNWDAPLLISPHDHKTLYFAANKVFKSSDMGSSWTEISDDLSQQIDRHRLPVMGKIQSVDAISYDRSTSPYGNIVALDESPLQEGLLYVGTDDGLIQMTDDSGQNWQRRSDFPGIPKNTYVNQVLASRHDKNTVFAVFNNHKNGDFKPYILKSSNQGKSWQSIAGNLPDRGSVFTLQQDHQDPDLLFAGTEFGVFTSINGGQSWKQLKSGLPTIAIRDMDIQRRENDLVLASFGRGFYVLDNYAPLSEIDQEVLKKEAHLFNIKDVLLFKEARPLGYGKLGFMGASHYAADNAPRGAVLTYYLREAPQSLKAQRQEAEKAQTEASQQLNYPSLEYLRKEDQEESTYLLFIISDARGQEVARFTTVPEAGVNRVNWDGHYSATASLKEAGAPLTQNATAGLVPPGQYTASMFLSENGKLRKLDQEQSFKVDWLGNNTWQAEDRDELVQFQKEIEETRRKVYALDRYKDNLKNRIQSLKASTRNTPGADLSLLDSLRGLELQLLAVERKLNDDQTMSQREFQTPPSLMDRISDVVWDSYGSTGAPTASQRKNISIAKVMYNDLRKQIQIISDKVEEIGETLTELGAPYLEYQLPE